MTRGVDAVWREGSSADAVHRSDFHRDEETGTFLDVLEEGDLAGRPPAVQGPRGMGAVVMNKTGLAPANHIYYSRYMDREATILALAALAQATRLDAFRLLVKHEPEGLPQGELAQKLAVPQNTLSSHLNILARAGLIRSERHSRSIIYRADLMRLRDLMLYLVRDCCGSRPELCEPLIEELTTPCCPPHKSKKKRQAHA